MAAKLNEAEKLYMLAADAFLNGPADETISVARNRFMRGVKAADAEALQALIMERRKQYAGRGEETAPEA